MNWKHTLIIVVSILLIGMGLGYLISYNAKETRNLHQELIEIERKAIDSLYKELEVIKSERETMESQLNVLTNGIRISESNLSTKINQHQFILYLMELVQPLTGRTFSPNTNQVEI